MKKWIKTAGLIFLAAASVYSDRAIAAKPAKPANATDKPTTDVKVLEEADPFASPGPTTEPTAVTTTTDAKAPAAPVLVNPDGTFSLNITAGADIVEQLRVIGFQSQMSIIPSREVHGALPAMDLYNVTVHEALDAMLHTNGYAWREKGKFVYIYSAKEIADMERESRVTHTEVFRLFYVNATDARSMIAPVLSKEGGEIAMTPPAKSGITSGVGDLGGDNLATNDVLVVTDYPENLDKVRQVLKEIDRRPQQILIEATILRASLNEDNALGVDFNVVGGVNFSNIVHSNGQFTNATLANSVATAGETQSSVGTGNSFTSGIPNGFKVGVVTDNLSVFLAALEGVTDTTILANPKVLALNKQRGEVIIGREDGYITTTTTETSSTQTIEFLKTGTRLVFRPYIGDDGYIRMEVHPEDSSGGLQTAANLPFKITTEVSSNVMVKDGHTIVIGGLFRESSDSTRSQVPLLGNLPIAGALFRNQHDTSKREEVIILLTPHIVKDDEAMNQMSQEAMKDAERLRVGVRKGMMFWGRERLADMNYEIAVEEMNKSHPDRQRALWHLDAATNLNPKFIEAIKLKEELSGKVITAADTSTVRTFVTRAILADRAPATQPSVDASPSTQPAETVALATPATQPAVETVAALPSTQPTTQPSVAENPQAEDPETTVATQTVTEVKTEEVAVAPEVSPSTQPVAEVDNSDMYDDESEFIDEPVPQTAVTELPTEEVTSSPAMNDNK